MREPYLASRSACFFLISNIFPSSRRRKALSEVTACLRERLHRWQQIEKLCSFPIVSNQGLSSLTATLYSDHSWVVMPRVGVPPYPIAGGVDDLDEDTPPIIPQFTCE